MIVSALNGFHNLNHDNNKLKKVALFGIGQNC